MRFVSDYGSMTARIALWISCQVRAVRLLSERNPVYALAHTMYAQAHTSGKKRKRNQPFGMYALAHTRSPAKARLQMAPQGAQSARQGTQKARMRAPAGTLRGVCKSRLRMESEGRSGPPHHLPSRNSRHAARGWSRRGD